LQEHWRQEGDDEVEEDLGVGGFCVGLGHAAAGGVGVGGV
jgi:hypothetical protein